LSGGVFYFKKKSKKEKQKKRASVRVDRKTRD